MRKSSSPTTINKIKQNLAESGKYWLVFTGDSITSCEWVHPNWREIVEYVLKNEAIEDDDWKLPSWGIRCFNFAFDGATTNDILSKVDDINLVKPDLVISLMGGNDPLLKLSISESVANIENIKDKLKSNIVWCTSTPADNSSPENKTYEPYALATMQIPQSEKFRLIDMFNIYKKFPTDKFFTFKSEENPVAGVKEGEPDLWHPNQLGNAFIAKVILKEVFGIEFNPGTYILDVLVGEKLPKY